MVLKDHTHAHLQAHHHDFGEFAERMVETHEGRFDAVFWGFLERYAPAEPARILDLGTGPGLLLRDLRKRFARAELIGVEAQPMMLEKARPLARAESAQIIEYDLAGGEIPGLAPAGADLVIASMVLHELQVPTVMLDEIARVLKPGGTALIYDWVRQPLVSYFEGERPSTLEQFTRFSEHCRYTPEDLAWLMERSGFEVLEWMARNDGQHALFAVTRG